MRSSTKESLGKKFPATISGCLVQNSGNSAKKCKELVKSYCIELGFVLLCQNESTFFDLARFQLVNIFFVINANQSKRSGAELIRVWQFYDRLWPGIINDSLMNGIFKRRQFQRCQINRLANSEYESQQQPQGQNLYKRFHLGSLTTSPRKGSRNGQTRFLYDWKLDLHKDGLSISLAFPVLEAD